MQVGFVIAWVLALLLIGLLLVLLAPTLVGRVPRVSAGKRESAPALSKDTLLFYYEEDSVRSTTDGRLIVHIPGLAWDAGWRDDLIRVEVVEQPVGSIALRGELHRALPLACYSLAAYRMTEMGNDVKIVQFPEPIDVILTHSRANLGLGVVTGAGDSWHMAPAALISPRQFDQVDMPTGRGWAAAAIAHVGSIALVQLPNPAAEAER